MMIHEAKRISSKVDRQFGQQIKIINGHLKRRVQTITAMNGLYLQLHAYMLRIAFHGISDQPRALANVAGKLIVVMATSQRQNIQLNSLN